VTIHYTKAFFLLEYYHRKCTCVTTHAHLCSSVSCFGSHLAKILWLYKLFSLTECTDSQPMSKLLAMSATVTCLSSCTKPFTHSMLSTTHGWMAWAVISICSVTLVSSHLLAKLTLCNNFLHAALTSFHWFFRLWLKLIDCTLLSPKAELTHLNYDCASFTKQERYLSSDTPSILYCLTKLKYEVKSSQVQGVSFNAELSIAQWVTSSVTMQQWCRSFCSTQSTDKRNSLLLK
jgi:hypothetical protein